MSQTRAALQALVLSPSPDVPATIRAAAALRFVNRLRIKPAYRTTLTSVPGLAAGIAAALLAGLGGDASPRLGESPVSPQPSLAADCVAAAAALLCPGRSADTLSRAAAAFPSLLRPSSGNAPSVLEAALALLVPPPAGEAILESGGGGDAESEGLPALASDDESAGDGGDDDGDDDGDDEDENVLPSEPNHARGTWPGPAEGVTDTPQPISVPTPVEPWEDSPPPPGAPDDGLTAGIVAWARLARDVPAAAAAAAAPGAVRGLGRLLGAETASPRARAGAVCLAVGVLIARPPNRPGRPALPGLDPWPVLLPGLVAAIRGPGVSLASAAALALAHCVDKHPFAAAVAIESGAPVAAGALLRRAWAVVSTPHAVKGLESACALLRVIAERLVLPTGYGPGIYYPPAGMDDCLHPMVYAVRGDLSMDHERREVPATALFQMLERMAIRTGAHPEIDSRLIPIGALRSLNHCRTAGVGIRMLAESIERLDRGLRSRRADPPLDLEGDRRRAGVLLLLLWHICQDRDLSGNTVQLRTHFMAQELIPATQRHIPRPDNQVRDAQRDLQTMLLGPNSVWPNIKPPRSPKEAAESPNAAVSTAMTPLKFPPPAPVTSELTRLPSAPLCAACSAPAAGRCAGCHSVGYCGPGCQASHWEQHKAACAVAAEAAHSAGEPPRVVTKAMVESMTVGELKAFLGARAAGVVDKADLVALARQHAAP